MRVNRRCSIIKSGGEHFDWYVDSVSGNDSNSGQNINQPLKTLSTLVGKTFSANQKVGIKCGSVFREMLSVPSDNLTFKSYGYGNKPQFIGSSSITTWTNTPLYDGIAANWDYANESFEGTGYSEGAVWSEVLGAGSTADEDSTAVTPPTGGGSQVLKIQKVSPNFNAIARRTLSSERAITYTSFYLYINAEGLADSQQMDIVYARDTALINVWRIALAQSPTNILKLRSYVYSNNTDQTMIAEPVINLNTWYHVEVKYDSTNLTYDLRLDGTSLANGSITGTPRTGIRQYNFGSASFSYTLTMYADLFQVSSTNFYIPQVSLSTNCWKASRTLCPGLSTSGNGPIWFITASDGKTHHATKKSSMAELAAEYDWFWDTTYKYLIVYTTGNPNTLYSSVEVAEDRSCGVTTNGNSHIKFINLETKYTRWRGFWAGNPSGAWDQPVGDDIIFDGCVSRYSGSIFGKNGGEGGDGIRTHSTNTIIRNCLVHDSGIIGINVREGANDCVVEHCTVYNCYHFNIEAKAGAYDANRPTFRYNLTYTDSDYADFTVSACGIGINLEATSSVGRIADVKIYSNIVHHINGQGINISDGCVGGEIYNNTVYGLNASKDASIWAAGINIDDNNNSNVKIKNNISIDSGAGGCLCVANATKVSSCDYNLWYQSAAGTVKYVAVGPAYHFDDQAAYKTATGFDTNGLWQDALLVSTSDFHLQSGSPCRNAGVNLSLIRDFSGASVSNPPDIGAYKY